MLIKKRKKRSLSFNSTGWVGNPKYMGKFRLKKILYHYIFVKYGEKMLMDFASMVQECETPEQFYIEQEKGTGAFYAYFNGYPGCNEWIHCFYNEYHFTVEACCGEETRVTIDDRWFDGISHGNKIITYYDENFVPNPLKTELLGDIAHGKELKPFADDNTIYDGFGCDDFVCQDIAKTAPKSACHR